MVFHSIEWMRAYTRKNQIKQHKRSVARNYKRIYKEIKWRAKQGFYDAIIRFRIYDENFLRLKNEGYKISSLSLSKGAWTIEW